MTRKEIKERANERAVKVAQERHQRIEGQRLGFDPLEAAAARTRATHEMEGSEYERVLEARINAERLARLRSAQHYAHELEAAEKLRGAPLSRFYVASGIAQLEALLAEERHDPS